MVAASFSWWRRESSVGDESVSFAGCCENCELGFLWRSGCPVRSLGVAFLIESLHSTLLTLTEVSTLMGVSALTRDVRLMGGVGEE